MMKTLIDTTFAVCSSSVMIALHLSEMAALPVRAREHCQTARTLLADFNRDVDAYPHRENYANDVNDLYHQINAQQASILGEEI